MPAAGKLLVAEYKYKEKLETLIPRLLDENAHNASFVARQKLDVWPNAILHWLDAHSYYFDQKTRRWVKRQPETTSAA